MANKATNRKLLTLTDAAEMYSISRRTLERAAKAGEIRLYRLNRRVVRVSEAELDALFGLDARVA
ncbi:helix-turn-helix transcriptional regulator [Corynebacterium suedekumii]|uniref:Helix-turn-helix domain-containing protein n=1 Tax=Corynebacterium suedekumii TaxID=3049801 RepID=A0ABY8VK02_9CORY|nr:helix-turn-helix domain-containing protein [Corynebacterium suedekumii]WIM69115.1 helix-turn-helix domain-containing protein [Corynebacterium suedekumii]